MSSHSSSSPFAKAERARSAPPANRPPIIRSPKPSPPFFDLEVLSNITPVRIGLSATVAPIDDIANFLVGMERECLIAEVQTKKVLDIQVLTGVSDLIDTDKYDLHSSLYTLIDQLIQEHRTTVIFTNTRSATERVINHLKDE